MAFRDSFRALVSSPHDGDTKAVGSLLAPAAIAARRGDSASVVWGNGPRPSGGRFSSKSARRHLEAYAGREDAIGWVMICADLIAQTAANADFHFEDESGKEIPKTRASAEAYERPAPIDLVMLLERPNPYQSYEDLITLLWIDWLLTGDALMLKWGMDDRDRPASLYRLNPSHVEVIPGPPGGAMIESYEYKVPGMEGVNFTPDEILHIKRPNPHSEYRGSGIIAGDPRAFDMQIALTDTKARYYENGARLSGVLETDRAMNDGLIAKIRRQFMGTYGGKNNAYKVAVLERGLKFNAISNSAIDAAFGETTKESRDYIFALFGIPKSMFGIEGEHAAKVGGAADDRREFANNKMRPMLDRFETAITVGLVEPGWELRFCVEYKYQMPQEAKVELAGEFAKLPGVTIKEIREFIDLDPLGDERDNIVLNLPGENDNESEVKDRNLGNEAGRPPNGENTAAIPPPGEALPPDATAVVKP